MKKKILNFLFNYGYELFYFCIFFFLSIYLFKLCSELEELNKEQIEINKDIAIKNNIDSFYIFNHSKLKQ